MAEMTTEKTRMSNKDLVGQEYGDFDILRHLGDGHYLLRCKKCKNEIVRSGTQLRKKAIDSTCAECNRVHPILTSTELKIARLVADGMTNKQIAAEMITSDRTVQSHLQNIYGKLDFVNRFQLVAYMLKKE